jgi:hypothetical protein
VRFGGDGLAVDFESIIIGPWLVCQIKEKQIVLNIMFMFHLFDTHWLCILLMAIHG